MPDLPSARPDDDYYGVNEFYTNWDFKISGVSCAMPVKVPEGQDVVSVDVEQEEQKEDPTPRDSEDIENSMTPFERMAQTMLDNLRQAYNLDPTGEHRAVCVMVTLDNGKTFQCLEDSTEEAKFKGLEVWSRAYVEAEVTKIKTAFPAKPAGPVSGNDIDKSPV